jgi:histidinol dehydrogenase
MNVLRFTDQAFAERVRELTAHSSLLDPMIEERTRQILDSVRARGDAALVELTRKFNGATLAPEQFAITQAEFVAAALRADDELREAVSAARRNVERFSRKALRRDWSTRNAQAGIVGEKFDPFQRVGIYIPGGTAPLVSTALMTITLAKVAGCPEIVVSTPCGPDGAISPALLFAIRTAGATEVYRLGGAQAIAALTYGTSTVPRVQKIFGPGNAYVVAAKRLLFGHVAIDLLPGPSEVLVVADDTARPDWIAADLLAQAEHGSGHERVWLLTPSYPLLRAVQREIKRQLPERARHELIAAALSNHGWLIQVPSLDDAAGLANAIAPEHCEIMTRHPAKLAGKIVSAGAIFLGACSPTVLGDYLAGPSHTLPTGGGAASFAGLTVDQFQRRTSLVHYDRKALRNSLAVVRKFAALEGLDAHGHSAAIRLARMPTRRRAKRKRPD